jgi:transposase
VQLCKERLLEDAFSGCVFIFRCRSPKSIRVICYDGQGFWMAQKRLSEGRFRWWPEADSPAASIRAHQAQTLFAGGNPNVSSAPDWRPIKPIAPPKQVPGRVFGMNPDGEAQNSHREPQGTRRNC